MNKARLTRWTRFALDLAVGAGVIAALIVNAQALALPTRIV